MSAACAPHRHGVRAGGSQLGFQQGPGGGRSGAARLGVRRRGREYQRRSCGRDALAADARLRCDLPSGRQPHHRRVRQHRAAGATREDSGVRLSQQRCAQRGCRRPRPRLLRRRSRSGDDGGAHHARRESRCHSLQTAAQDQAARQLDGGARLRCRHSRERAQARRRRDRTVGLESTQPTSGDVMDVEVTGRLDAYWADHLSAALEDAMRGGAHNIRLNMSRVSYMSSVGIRVLLKFYKQLQRINGTFAVSQPSEPVKTVLELAGLEILLAATGATAATHSPATSARRLDREGTAFEIFAIAPNAQLSCRVVGQPELLEGCGFTAQHGRTIAFPTSALGGGPGAFGDGFADCQGRFGEFLAAAGAAAYLPTDGTNVPDYLVSTGAFVPSVHVLYALICEGRLATLAWFATTRHNGVGLADLVEASLERA